MGALHVLVIHFTPIPHPSFLAALKAQNGLPFWYWLIGLLEYWPLNEDVDVDVVHITSVL